MVRRRNAMIASRAFRYWAARTPGVRLIARARARETFSLVVGFVYSQVLAACHDCGLFDVLAGEGADRATVAQRCALPPAAALRLLRAAASLHLAEQVGDDRWMLGRIGAAIHADAGIGAMIRHHRLLYADLADPLALLRRDSDRTGAAGGGGALDGFWPYDDASAGGVAAYSALMAASQPMIAAQATSRYRFDRHRRMLDVGGGSGGFAAAVGAVAPKLERTVFDLPAVVATIADPAVHRLGGSFVTDPLPSGFDLITLVRVLHDHDDAVVRALLAKARAALAPGSTLLIVEPMAGVRGDTAMGDAYFGMYLLAMGSGRARRRGEIEAMLAAAGFARSRVLATDLPLVAGMIAATA